MPLVPADQEPGFPRAVPAGAGRGGTPNAAPERAKGGVELVSAVPVAEIQGPIQKESDEGAYELYIAPYVQPASLVVQPTPTPVPVYVYCNDGGKNYHTKDCRYVKKTSARVTLEQAVAAGFTRCAKCDAPEYG